ncbi:MAG: ubiquitin-like protein Pup [Candidatus Rokubacteria bacterium]|nr:ubiquitin-like protein Pup [Candidatus Rokubacteria bacterium]
MAQQERRSRRAADPERQDEAPPPNPKVAEKGATIRKTIDKVLDEIDNVLEENAEEFVKSYVQRGGE